MRPIIPKIKCRMRPISTARLSKHVSLRPASESLDLTAHIQVATESGQPVEWMHEENYMFRLTHFRERLLSWLKDMPNGKNIE